MALWDRSKKGCFVNEYILSVFDVVGPVFRIKIYHHFLSLYLFTKPLIHCTHILLATPCTLQAHTNTIILTVRTKTLIYWTGTSSLHFYFFYSYPTMQQCSRNDQPMHVSNWLNLSVQVQSTINKHFQDIKGWMAQKPFQMLWSGGLTFKYLQST